MTAPALGRGEVEALLATSLRVADVGMMSSTFPAAVAELCRVWLAVEDAPVVDVDEGIEWIADGNDVAYGAVEAPASMIGQRVRLVAISAEGAG